MLARFLIVLVAVLLFLLESEFACFPHCSWVKDILLFDSAFFNFIFNFFSHLL